MAKNVPYVSVPLENKYVKIMLPFSFLEGICAVLFIGCIHVSGICDVFQEELTEEQ